MFLIYSKSDKIASLWGGVVRNVYTQRVHNNDEYKTAKKFSVYSSYCVAVLITGPIQSWSIVVDQKCNTKVLVEEKLKLFKDQIKLRKYSVGFMFSCIGRNVENAETNTESIIFKTVFPNVPLVGCFGDGEFGKNTISDKIKETSNFPISFSTKILFLEKIHTIFISFQQKAKEKSTLGVINSQPYL